MYAPLKEFKFWCQKVLPLVYDDSLSYYEVLCKVVAFLNEMVKRSNSLADAIERNDERITALEADLRLLNTEIEKIKAGGYISVYIEALRTWINEHITELIGDAIKGVVFGLTDDGYFVAYVPDAWDSVEFSTITEGDLYGHLVLIY